MTSLQQAVTFTHQAFSVATRNGKIITAILLGAVIAGFLLHLFAAFYFGFQASLSDELSYFKNVHSFSENRSAGVPIAYDLNYSKIGEYSSHGPFYTYVYGAIPALFGTAHPQWMLIQNTILCFAALALGWSSVKLAPAGKNMVALIMATNLIFVTYIHLYMVEAAHIFAVALLAWLTLKNDAEHRRTLLVATIIIAAFLLSLTRISWIALYALAPLQCRSRRGLLISLLLSAGALLINLWIYSNLFASYESGFLFQLFQTLDKDGTHAALQVLASRFVDNIELYQTYTITNHGTPFSYVYRVYKALYILIFAISAYLAWRTKDRLLVGMVLVNLATIMALMFLYDAYTWREHRSLNTIYILNIIFMARYLKLYVLALITTIQLLCLPAVIQAQHILEQEYRRNFRHQHDASAQLITDLAHLKELPAIERDDLITIGAGIDIIPQRKSVFLLEMPVRSSEGVRIRYSMAVNKPLQAEGHDYVLQLGGCTIGSLHHSLPSFDICTTGTPR